jgi:pimeloyl-ACP methyl ester carboxylesterase
MGAKMGVGVGSLMRRILFVGLVGSLGGAPALAEAASDTDVFGGTWVGTYEQASAGPAYIGVRIDTHPAQIGVTVRRERFRGAKATNIVIDDDRISFDLDSRIRNWHFELKSIGGRLDGQIENRNDKSRCPLQLERILPLELATFKPYVGDLRTSDGDVFFVGYFDNSSRGNPPSFYVTLGDRAMQILPVAKDRFLAESGARVSFERAPDGGVSRLRWEVNGKATRIADRVVLWREEEVSFESPSAHLSGTLYLPIAKGPHPALVVVHGSGPQIRLDTWQMADRFARAGIACLAFDKRGAGKSTGDWHEAGFDVLAEDVLAGVELLRSRAEIRRDQIGLWGVSQAGWVIPLAASKSDHVAFCIPVSGGAVSPAEQELWRRTEYLKYFGCGPVLVEAMRRGVAMHYQWEELFKGGRFPIPPIFEVEPLNMYHDAPAVIRQVHQPVLAIFGELDRLTPPKESAAIWARELGAAGNRDYAVRIFPRATHGLLETDGTGVPFEIMPETRLATGYVQTMIDWIKDHANGHAASRSAIEPEDVVQSRGMRELPWYGSAPVQAPLLVACMLGSLFVLVGWPVAWAMRRIRRLPGGRQSRRRTIVTGWMVNFVALAMCVSAVSILHFLGEAAPSGYYRWAEIGLWVLSTLTLGLAGFALLLIRAAHRADWPSRGARVFFWITAVTVCLWVPFFVYWTWGPLLN